MTVGSMDQGAVSQVNSAGSQSQPQFEVFPSDGIVPPPGLPVLGDRKKGKVFRLTQQSVRERLISSILVMIFFYEVDDKFTVFVSMPFLNTDQE